MHGKEITAMKAKLQAFQNYGNYIEYAELIKAHWWSRWHYLRNDNGHRALYKFTDADNIVVKTNGGRDK